MNSLRHSLLIIVLTTFALASPAVAQDRTQANDQTGTNARLVIDVHMVRVTNGDMLDIFGVDADWAILAEAAHCQDLKMSWPKLASAPWMRS